MCKTQFMYVPVKQLLELLIFYDEYAHMFKGNFHCYRKSRLNRWK